MASSKLNQTNLTFTDSSSNTGTLDFTANEFNMDKPVLISNGITSTQLSVSGNGKITAISSVDTLNIDNLTFKGSTSGEITLQANPTTTIHTLTFPDSQGTTGSYLTNDGSGDLSWSVFNESYSGVSGNRKHAGYIDIGGTRIQYGKDTCSNDSPQTVTLPASFSNTSYSIQVSVETDDTNILGDPIIGTAIKISSRTTSTFVFDRDDDIDNTIDIHWVAIGQV